MSESAGQAKSDEVKRLKKLVEDLINSGDQNLDTEAIKEVKRICKGDAQSIPFVYDLLVANMRRKHSQVRVSTLQIADQLFNRSHVFRELLVGDLKEILDLVMETSSSPSAQLPPPKAAREQLKKLSLEVVKQWVSKFGEGYKKLTLAYNYLKQVRKVDFEDEEARSVVQRRRKEQRKEKEDNIWKERVRKTKQEMEEVAPDIHECLVQLDACLDLLVPKPEEFDFDCADENEVGAGDGREHGIVSSQQPGISIDLSEVTTSFSTSNVKVTEDNEVVLESLRDQYHVLTNKLILLVKKWSATLAKAGVDRGADSDTLKRAIDAKQVIESAIEKVDSLGVDLSIKKKRKTEEDDSSDDDDFVEVEEKEGYEEFVVASSSSSVTPCDPEEPKPSASGAKSESGPLLRTSSADWKLGLANREEESDPTTFAATLKKMKTDSITVFNKGKPSKVRSDSSAPRLPFDVDLLNWGEKKTPQKVLVDPEKLRFWGSSSSAAEGELEVPGSADTTRMIEFSGQFKPVDWSCRAPMPSGRLCPRRDRVKCPFHGRIIPRDNMGCPSKLEDKVREDEEKERKANENPDWQDPELLKDIEAATGLDLKIPKKGERLKSKSKKKRSGLISVKDELNTVRKRLEKKLFNRSAMKRVASTLNRLDANRHNDKFADQFNYVFAR